MTRPLLDVRGYVMKNVSEYDGFEQGPIRPPSEAGSLLVRITRNCPWNRCTFCPVYKGSSFSLRPVDHVLKDIDLVRGYVETLLAQRGRNNAAPVKELLAAQKNSGRDERQAFYAAWQFVDNGMESIFLQDGNSLIIKPADLIRILKHLKKSFPTVTRITSYARSHTIARIQDDDLSGIREAGLNRIHIGMESGSDEVLRRVKKGADKATHIKAGLKVKQAGMELSEYLMPGLGGRDLSREHAMESADALNRINPDFIRFRTLALPAAIPLSEDHVNGSFQKIGEVETAAELLLLLESLQGIDSMVKSDHVLNLFSEVEGQLPQDRERMLQPIRAFLAASPTEQMVFIIGRRTHCLNRFADMEDGARRAHAEAACRDLGATVANVDAIVAQIAARFI